MRATGIPPLPAQAYRLPDPGRRESWYYENWVDTAESERVLRYQRHSFADYLSEHRRRLGPARILVRAFGRLIRTRLLKTSPYAASPPVVDGRDFAEAARAMLRSTKG